MKRLFFFFFFFFFFWPRGQAGRPRPASNVVCGNIVLRGHSDGSESVELLMKTVAGGHPFWTPVGVLQWCGARPKKIVDTDFGVLAL